MHPARQARPRWTVNSPGRTDPRRLLLDGPGSVSRAGSTGASPVAERISGALVHVEASGRGQSCGRGGRPCLPGRGARCGSMGTGQLYLSWEQTVVLARLLDVRVGCLGHVAAEPCVLEDRPNLRSPRSDGGFFCSNRQQSTRPSLHPVWRAHPRKRKKAPLPASGG